MTDDLSTRVLEAIDAAERVANACLLGAGSSWSSRGGQILDEDGAILVNTARATEVYVRHMALWDPKAALRLGQAHREIVEHWQATRNALDAAEGTILAGACKVRLGAYNNVLKALARAYGIEEDE